MAEDYKKDLHESDINKDGTFVDENGVTQIAVPLSSIFNMVGGNKPKPKAKPEQTTPPVRKPKRGIKR